MRNFTAVYADLKPEEVAEIMANPKCRFGSHADLAAERDTLAEEIAWLRVELSVEEKRSSEQWELLSASQDREAKLFAFIHKWVDIGPDNQEMMAELRELK